MKTGFSTVLGSAAVEFVAWARRMEWIGSINGTLVGFCGYMGSAIRLAASANDRKEVNLTASWMGTLRADLKQRVGHGR